MNTTTFASLRAEFVMSEEHVNFLKSLPENLPETKLTKKQVETVSGIYYTYISNKICRGWGQDLAEFEQKSERWPSGPRVKRHEAQRMILGDLVFINQYKKDLTPSAAASFFFSCVSMRESYQILVSKVYTLNG